MPQPQGEEHRWPPRARRGTSRLVLAAACTRQVCLLSPKIVGDPHRVIPNQTVARASELRLYGTNLSATLQRRVTQYKFLAGFEDDT